MGEHDNHRKRVYKRFLNEGLAGFEEHNALEFLLFLAKSRGDTNIIAHRLIDKFGSLSEVLEASVEELMEVDGIGEVSAVSIKLIPDMCAYYMESKIKNVKKLNTTQLVADFFLPKFFAKTSELFYFAAVDDCQRLLRCVLVSQGTGNFTAVSIAKIVAAATRCQATGIILAHNHPRATTLPSSSDLTNTIKIYKALKTVNIELIDHLIFSNNEYLSFAQTNYMQSIKDS